MTSGFIKMLLVANFIFLIFSVICVSNVNFEEAEGSSVREEETKKIQATIQNETNIEKLRQFAQLSLVVQNGAYETVDTVLEASRTTIRVFSGMFTLNIILLFIFLFGNKKKSNKLINADGK